MFEIFAGEFVSSFVKNLIKFLFSRERLKVNIHSDISRLGLMLGLLRKGFIKVICFLSCNRLIKRRL